MDYRYNNGLLRYVFNNNNLFINMKYYLVYVGSGFYYTTEKPTLRKYGGRKTKKEKEKEKECNHLIVKKGLWFITFD
tara:strand:+ start:12657 stop:12887 length:231 start_codon:yes stop_codon:yes gene_type:complete